MPIVIDLIGKKFGRLTVLKRYGYSSNGKTKLIAWLCKCDCDKIVKISGSSLIRGRSKSCGCYGLERRIVASKTHGLSDTPIHIVWKNMKHRASGCFDKNDKRNRHYNNISMCDAWNSFLNFYAWAKDKWKAGLVIDRINTTKNYSPNNCRFVTPLKSQQNRTDSKYWFINGKRFESASDAAGFFKLAPGTIHLMCLGRMRDGRWYPPTPLCYAVKKYDNY